MLVLAPLDTGDEFGGSESTVQCIYDTIPIFIPLVGIDHLVYRDTANKAGIDWIAKRVREIYDYDRLKDRDIGYLYTQEFGMRADTQLFETIFPSEESAIQGPARAFLLDQENAERAALTEAEILCLHLLKKEAEIEIRRAFGHRKVLRRKHRNKLANSVSDALSSLGSLIPWS